MTVPMRECLCGELCPESATICDCGRPLKPLVTTQHETPLAPIPQCSCPEPGLGLCVVCDLASYEPTIVEEVAA